jgi:hypothetical protein
MVEGARNMRVIFFLIHIHINVVGGLGLVVCRVRLWVIFVVWDLLVVRLLSARFLFNLIAFVGRCLAQENRCFYSTTSRNVLCSQLYWYLWRVGPPLFIVADTINGMLRVLRVK